MRFIRFLISLVYIHCSFLLSSERSESLIPTTLYIVRHGQTDWNVEKRIQGVSDIPLNEAGKLQVAALRDMLNSLSFSYCYSSDLQRAVQTAHILLEGNGFVPVQLDSRLRQRNFGSWEGRLYDELHDSLQWQRQVESDTAMQERIVTCLYEIAERHKGAYILIITHGGVMRNLIATASTVFKPEEIQVENMAILTLKIYDGRMHIEGIKGICFQLSDVL